MSCVNDVASEAFSLTRKSSVRAGGQSVAGLAMARAASASTEATRAESVRQPLLGEGPPVCPPSPSPSQSNTAGQHPDARWSSAALRRALCSQSVRYRVVVIEERHMIEVDCRALVSHLGHRRRPQTAILIRRGSLWFREQTIQ